MRRLSLLLMALVLAGCAVGNQYDYRSSDISLPLKSAEQKNLVLSIEDLRPYVLDGDKEPNFVGLQRGGFGNPFDVTTVSGKSLTEDMSVAISKALSGAGYQVVDVKGTAETGYMVNTAAENGASRILAMKVKEWKSDIAFGITILCDVGLTVYDADGRILAENEMKFIEEIGGAQIGASKNSQAVSDEFAKRIGYLFNKKEIRSVLR